MSMHSRWRTLTLVASLLLAGVLAAPSGYADGVTVLTHGWNADLAGTPAWLGAMRDDIAAIGSAQNHAATVQVNAPPNYQGGLADQVISPVRDFEYQFADDLFVDPDGEPLTYEAERQSGGALPGWVNFDAPNRRFWGTAPESSDDIDVKVIASDPAGASDYGSFRFQVHRQPPVYNGGLEDQSYRPTASFTYQFGENVFTDPDGDILSYAATLDGGTLPGWLDFDGDARTFTRVGTDPVATNDYLIEVTASDPEGSASGTFTLTIAANQSPVYHGGLADQEYLVDTSFTTDPFSESAFTDPEDDPLAYEATLANDDPLPAWLTFHAAARNFSGTTPATAGQWQIEVTATDTYDASAAGQFTFTVTGNLTPVYHGLYEDQEWGGGREFWYPMPDGTFTDPDGDTLTYDATRPDGNPLPDFVHIDPDTGVIYGDAPNERIQLSIKVTADDGRGKSASGTFEANVFPNHAPGGPSAATILVDYDDNQDNQIHETEVLRGGFEGGAWGPSPYAPGSGSEVTWAEDGMGNPDAHTDSYVGILSASSSHAVDTFAGPDNYTLGVGDVLDVSFWRKKGGQGAWTLFYTDDDTKEGARTELFSSEFASSGTWTQKTYGPLEVTDTGAAGKHLFFSFHHVTGGGIWLDDVTLRVNPVAVSGSHAVSSGSWFSPDPNLTEYGDLDWATWNSRSAPAHQKDTTVDLFGDLESDDMGFPAESDQVAGQFVWDASDSTSTSPAGPDISNAPDYDANGGYWDARVTLPQTEGGLSVWTFNVNEGDPDTMRFEVADGSGTKVYTSGDITNVGGTAFYRFDLEWTGAAIDEIVTVNWIYASKTGNGRLGFMGAAVSEEGLRPTVATAQVTNIAPTAADGGGEVTDDGGLAVTARGVCWNTAGGPTTAADHTTDGSGTGAFASHLTGLATQITYFVRAYAINAAGTCYGEERVFTTGNWTPPGNALDFDGVDDHVNCGADVVLSNRSFSIEFWAQRQSTGTRDSVVGQGNAGENQELFVMFRDDDTFTFAFFGNDLDTADTYTDANWHHWACTYDASNNARMIYRDGVEVAANTASADYQGSGVLYIARRGSAAERYFDGRLDDLRIWNDVRTEAEVRDYMHCELDGDEAGLTAHFPMNQRDTMALDDLTVNDNDGTLQNMDAGSDWVSSTIPCADAIAALANLRGAWIGKNNPTHASSILTLSDPNIAGADFVVFGHDGGDLAMGSGATKPSEFISRLGRVWRVEESGASVGDLAFDCSTVSGITDDDRLYLLVDDDGDFSDAVAYSGSYTPDTFSVTGHAYRHGAYYTLGETATGDVDTWYVDAAGQTGAAGFSWVSAFPRIQEGIDAAADGDTVLVKYGTYDVTNAVTLNDKDLHLTSDDGTHTSWTNAAYDADQTVVDAGGNARCLTVSGTGVTDNAVVRGLIFTNGDGTGEPVSYSFRPGGGGIYITEGAEVVIAHCTVSSCVGSDGGSYGGYGGGILVSESGTAPTIRDCTVTNNTAKNSGDREGYGGGIAVVHSAQAAIRACRIATNVAVGPGINQYGYGGGLYFVSSAGTVTDCEIAENMAVSTTYGGYGGGISLRGISPVDIVGCDIRDNRIRPTTDPSSGWNIGGGICLKDDRSGLSIENCLIRGNQAHGTWGGGGGIGIANNNETCAIRHNTFAGNMAGQNGSGIGGDMRQLSGDAVVENNIFANHTAGDGCALDLLGPTTVSYNCFHANSNPNLGVTEVASVTNDPLFADAPAGDFHLQSEASPCVDAGSNTTDVVTDRDGVPRPLDGDNDGTNTVDMGCYEYLNRAADTDGDTMTDRFEDDYGLDPTDPADADGNPDSDSFTSGEEFICDTDPTNPASYFCITTISNNSPVTVHFDSSSNRLYTMHGSSNLVVDIWTNVPGAGPRVGVGSADSMLDTNEPPHGPFYRLTVELP